MMKIKINISFNHLHYYPTIISINDLRFYFQTNADICYVYVEETDDERRINIKSYRTTFRNLNKIKQLWKELFPISPIK